MPTAGVAAQQQTFPVCALPGCAWLVTRWGEVCTDCQTAFGDYLTPGTGPAITEEQLRERDAGIRDIYTARLTSTNAPATRGTHR